MPQFQDLTGQKFGLLTVEYIAPKKGKQTTWSCKCECGKIKPIRATHLKSGFIKSCGCFKTRYGDKNPNFKHGKRCSPEYWPWQALKDRCTNKNRRDFQDYGGRGITVCDRWLNSFENFYSDMGPRPSPKHSVDRIDNNKGYSPENCRWATLQEQARNRRLRKDNTSGINGVSQTKNKWVAVISVNKEKIHLGSYETIHNAVSSRWVAEAIYYRNK